MKKVKRLLSYLVAVTLVLTALPFTVAETAAVDVNADASLVLNRPQASVIVTDVTRVAYASNSMKAPSDNNSVIVKSTPSGIPYLSSSKSNMGYMGETPVATTVVFTPGVVLDEAPSLSCSNPTVRWNDPTVSNGTYTWTVTGGTAMVGTTLVFTVSYKYSETNPVTQKVYTNTYTTSGTSFVEAIATPAGLYTTKRTYADWGLGTTTKNRSYIASYILGKNTYGSIYNNGAPDGSVAFSSSDWSSSSWTDEYGMMQNMGGSDASRNFNVAYKVDGNRPISTVYYDTSITSTLSDLNLRAVTTVMGQSDESDEIVTVHMDGLYVFEGLVNTVGGSSDEINLTSDEGARSELNMTVPTSSLYAIGSNFVSYFTGIGPGMSNGSKDYTILLNYRTPSSGGWGGVYVSHTYSIKIVSYDKGALRTLVENVQSMDPTVKITTLPEGDFKGYNPQAWYYSSGYENFMSELNSARSCLDKPNVTQAEIDSRYAALAAAYDALEMKTADYSLAGLYYNQALNKDPNNYTLASWARLQNLIDNYRDDYNALYQPAVDKLAADIKSAMDSLEERYADYSEIIAHLTTVNTLMTRAQNLYGKPAEDVYSGWSNLVSVLNKCGCSYNDLDGYMIENYLLISEQPRIDGYVLLIERALNALDLKSADYSNANKAENAYKVIRLNCVIDDIAENLTAAYNALVALHGLDIARQADIDNATATLNYWLDMVEYKPADTAAAEAKIAYANSLDRSAYGDFSGVDAAVANLSAKLTLDIRYQSEINRAVAALQSAIDNLTANSADYTLVDLAIEAVAERERLILETYEDSYGYTASTFYSNWDNVLTAINNVLRGLDTNHQNEVNGFASTINSALNALTENPADYSRVTGLRTQAYNICTTGGNLYTEESINGLLDIYLAVVNNLPISRQADVDSYADTLQEAIDGLEYLPADYSAVNTQITNANAKIAQDDAYSQAHPGYTYYTAESMADLEVALAAVVDGLDIRYQTTVNDYASAISDAIAALRNAPADYTSVYEALAQVPEDTSVYTTVSVSTLNAYINNVNYTYTSEKQTAVDKYATNILNAIDKLKYKSADYTEVNKALNRVPTDSSIYTEESWQALQDQVNAVVTGYNITRQAEVDAMAANINAALDLLAPKGANYDAVTAAKATIPSDLSLYTEESVAALNAVLDSINYYCDITQQSVVDGYAAQIEEAVQGLREIDADYRAVNSAVTNAQSKIDSGLYDDESVAAVNDAIGAVVYGLGTSHQAEVNAMAEAVNNAADAMEYKGANYDAVETAKTDAQAKIDSGLYTDESVSAVQAKMSAVQYGLNILHQSEVDAMATAITNAANAMEYLPADYDELENAITEANAKIETGYYTDESVAELLEALDAVVKGLNITHQNEIDLWKNDIVKATKDLIPKLADYTELQKILNLLDNSASEIYTISYTNFNEVMSLISAYRSEYVRMDVTIDRQSEVDEMVSTLQGYIDSLIPVVATESFEFVGTAAYKTDGDVKYAYGFKTMMTKAQLNSFVECENVRLEIVFAQGTRYIGTGSVIKVVSELTDEVIDEYTVVIYGDVDGNARIDASDAQMINLALSGQGDTLEGAARQAANVYGSRPTINKQDADAIVDAARGIYDIDQETGKVDR